MQRSPQERDRGLRRLRRWRQGIIVLALAASLGFTALAARAFPGRSRAPGTVATRSVAPAPQQLRANPKGDNPHRHRHHHHRSSSQSAPVAPPPAPVPAPTAAPPVVSSGGS